MGKSKELASVQVYKTEFEFDAGMTDALLHVGDSVRFDAVSTGATKVTIMGDTDVIDDGNDVYDVPLTLANPRCGRMINSGRPLQLVTDESGAIRVGLRSAVRTALRNFSLPPGMKILSPTVHRLMTILKEIGVR